ncbi:hypothetical protein Tsubulata_008425 [Turnera subulata]|uniref:J domain-containing protein n=1 Tax=Turnera subulata TaxID=218843 RepID=A0A9Q0JLB7_9ROSI|nr:hypothetical protein Tsubulata_008425 [Turnera subulata]
MNENSNRAEAERLIGIAEKLLHSRDLSGTRDFAILAQETEPLLEGSDQILAIADVLLSSEKRINNHHDWYSILQLERKANDADAIKKQYRRLALLLHPDKNKYPFADQAFKLVADAWAVLSDPHKKSLYDNELTLFAKVDLSGGSKLPVRRSQRPAARKQPGPGAEYAARSKVNLSGSNGVNHEEEQQHQQQQRQKARLSSFWTACPYCYVLFEYPRVYEDCCLRCQSCDRAFHAALIESLPPLVPGKEAYYCCWGFFPLGFVLSGGNGEKTGGADGAATAAAAGFPSWMPPIFGSGQQAASNGNKNGGAPPARMGVEDDDDYLPPPRVGVDSSTGPPAARAAAVASRGNATGSGPRKRGRPRKYPVQV